MISPRQIRAARALLDLSQKDLATLAGISTTGLNNIERANSDPKISTLTAIKTALEKAGVQFLSDGDTASGEGVALRAKA